MSNVIRLTENELITIIKSIVKEQSYEQQLTNRLKSANQQSNTGTACPTGYKQVPQSVIDSYKNSLKTPWSQTTDGSKNYMTLRNGVICEKILKTSTNDIGQMLKNMTLDQVASGFRDVISGVGGTVAQIIISGMGAHVINMVAWGLLVAYDIYSWVKKGTADWFNILHDLFWLLLSGVGGKIMGSMKSLIQGESNLVNVFAKLSKTKSWGYIKSILSKISGYGGKIVSKITESLNTIIKTFSSLKSVLQPLIGVLNRVGGLLKTIEQGFVKYTSLSVKKGTTSYVKSDLQGKVLNATAGQLK